MPKGFNEKPEIQNEPMNLSFKLNKIPLRIEKKKRWSNLQDDDFCEIEDFGIAVVWVSSAVTSVTVNVKSIKNNLFLIWNNEIDLNFASTKI